MPDYLLHLDRQLFHFINHDLGNAFFDWLMPLLRNAKFWIPLYVFIIGFCLYKFKKQGAVLILLLALSAGIADFTSVHLIKNNVERLRPCHDPVVSPTVISRAPCGSGYSFPSTHATDHFAMAAFLTLVFYRKWRWIWAWAFLWAASISFAQVYVGVHFPIDITVGMLYGVLIGVLMALLFKKL